MEPTASRVAAEAADLLSSFPAHLQDEILRRLDLRDAVRTSALSRAWRRRWETVAGLALSFPDDTHPCVVDRVLFLYAGPRVARFAVDVDKASISHVDHWLIALSRRTVQSISIHFQWTLSHNPRGYCLHSSIFSCAGLVSLRLSACAAIPPLPVGFAGFPVLEELYLSCDFPADHGDRQLQAIISGSPLLRVLYLEVHNIVDFLIEAPNLRSLTLDSGYTSTDWRFGELPCLQVAKLFLLRYPRHEHDFRGFFTGFAQVQVLALAAPMDEVKIDTTPFTFYNLKSLVLSTRFNAMNPILLMFCLLRSSPNLEKLKIELHRKKTVANWEFLNAQWTDGMCANLQVVEIISFLRWLPISFMKLILSKASLLQTLSVDECPRSQDDPLNELLTCRRASAKAQVLFKVQLEHVVYNV